MKVALDTNILAYAEGANGAAMRDRALEVIQRLPAGAVVLPVQTLGELFNVLVRKAKRRPARARAAVLSWRDAYPTAETSATVVRALLPTAYLAARRVSIFTSERISPGISESIATVFRVTGCTNSRCAACSATRAIRRSSASAG